MNWAAVNVNWETGEIKLRAYSYYPNNKWRKYLVLITASKRYRSHRVHSRRLHLEWALAERIKPVGNHVELQQIWDQITKQSMRRVELREEGWAPHQHLLRAPTTAAVRTECLQNYGSKAPMQGSSCAHKCCGCSRGKDELSHPPLHIPATFSASTWKGKILLNNKYTMI